MSTTDPLPRRALADIDVESVAVARSSSDGGFYDPADGMTIMTFMGELPTIDGEEVDPDELGWLGIDPEGSREGYEDMVEFADVVTDPVLSDRLVRALDGSGAFRRFRNTISEEGKKFNDLWWRFSDARTGARALRWLLSNNICDEAEVELATQQRRDKAELALVEAARWTRQTQ